MPTITDEPDHASHESPGDIGAGAVGADASGRVIGGVAVELGRRLGIDPLWLRLAFVGLAMFGGLGLIAYAGLWLMLIAARRSGWSVLRYLGGAVLLVGGGVLLGSGRTGFVGGPFAVAALLAGLAVSLWQPRSVPALAESPATTNVRADRPAVGVADRGAIRRIVDRRRQRPRSVLGRAALGIALLAAAATAVIDELNGGRLHPEQWLGIGAAICGAGALVGAWRGRALWLVLPGLLFAASGYVSGHAARAGVQTWQWGDAYYWIGADGEALPHPRDPGRVFGSAFVTIEDVPPSPRILSLRAGLGDVAITLDDDVTLEVRALLLDGRITVDDVEQPLTAGRATLVLGPDGSSDVVINVTISDGDVRVLRTELTPTVRRERPDPAPPFVEDALGSGIVNIGKGLMMGSDGTVLLPANRGRTPVGAISPTGEIWASSDSMLRDDGVTVVRVPDSRSEYLVLPNQMVITPAGALVDVPAARAEQVDRVSSPAATPAPPPARGGG